MIYFRPQTKPMSSLLPDTTPKPKMQVVPVHRSKPKGDRKGKKNIVLKKDAKVALYHKAQELLDFAVQHQLPLSLFLLEPNREKGDAEKTDYAVNLCHADLEFLHGAIVSTLQQHRPLATRLMKEMVLGGTGADGNIVMDEQEKNPELPFVVGDTCIVHPPPPEAGEDSEFLKHFVGKVVTIVNPGPTSSTVKGVSAEGQVVTVAFANHRLEKRDLTLEVEHAPETGAPTEAVQG